ncbi:MAG: biotin--[acetyl-CoA-carboxylase] ligase [Bacteroidales bacterium]|jgi:BirA family biotin operon repressor/biotin-[acetyl-CoA-carboxylase] ligase|nr:biotin--[acetyl-CoA-carboxylase] ligase [Bacteroidales bacterium]
MEQKIGHSTITVEETASTNRYVSDLLTSGATMEHGAVVRAITQTAGKGLQQNRWESAPAQNLTFSVFLKPDSLPANRQFLLSQAVSTGIRTFLSDCLTPAENCSIKIKWPNDIFVNNRKICGILIENTILGSAVIDSIVGIGLNVNQIQFSADIPNPTSLRMITGQQYALPELFNALLYSIDKYCNMLANGEWDELNSEYLMHLYKLQEENTFVDCQHEYTGKIVNITENGQLAVLDIQNNRQYRYNFKEVSYH